MAEVPVQLHSGRAVHRSAWLVGAVAAIAFNSRLALSAFPPLIPTIESQTRLSPTVIGIVGGVPVFCFGAAAPLAALAARRFGASATVSWSTGALVLAIGLRSLPTVSALLLGTLFAGCFVALANVLLPGLAKGQSPRTTGLAMGVYSAGITIGAAVATGASVPVLHSVSMHWRAALAVWALPGCAALGCWIAARRHLPEGRASDVPRVAWRSVLRSRLAWLITAFFALQVVFYYAIATWLPTVFVSRSIPQSTAGVLVAVINIASGIATFLVSMSVLRSGNAVVFTVASVALIAIGLGPIVTGFGPMWLWVSVMGLGLGGAFGLGFAFCLLHSSSSESAIALSGMSQTVGYLLGGIGPVVLGALHQLFGGWELPLASAGALLVPLLVVGIAAARSSGPAL